MALAVRLAILLAGGALAQQIGNSTPEVHPKVPSQYCTKAGGCKVLQTSFVADQTARSLHVVGQPDVKCDLTNRTLCPSGEKCSQNCALEGIDYEASGVYTEGNQVKMQLFNGKGSNGRKPWAARIYMQAEDGDNYQMMHLVNQEFTVDVDVSVSGCGVNAALYFIEMEAAGGRSDVNPAGARYGTGYCDAQCPKMDFINGVGNLDGKGACCQEMDIFEGNRLSAVYTPHTCNVTGLYTCSGDDCDNSSFEGKCDSLGCGANPFLNGARIFYGSGGSVDTDLPFTIVTQFISSNNTNEGDLVEIRRIYIQFGKQVMTTTMVGPCSNTTVSTMEEGIGSITDKYCYGKGYKNFLHYGGLRTMGEAFRRGMVLSISIWASSKDYMNWLDASDRGYCMPEEGQPKNIYRSNPDAAAIFSNIRWGDIGTTFDANATSH